GRPYIRGLHARIDEGRRVERVREAQPVRRLIDVRADVEQIAAQRNVTGLLIGRAEAGVLCRQEGAPRGAFGRRCVAPGVHHRQVARVVLNCQANGLIHGQGGPARRITSLGTDGAPGKRQQGRTQHGGDEHRWSHREESSRGVWLPYGPGRVPVSAPAHTRTTPRAGAYDGWSDGSGRQVGGSSRTATIPWASSETLRTRPAESTQTCRVAPLGSVSTYWRASIAVPPMVTF